MKKLALAICACALVAIAAPVFADDSMSASDTMSAATETATDATPTKQMKKAKHRKKRMSKKHNKHNKHMKKEVAQQNTATDATTDTQMN